METKRERSKVAVIALVLALFALGGAVGVYVALPSPAPDLHPELASLRNQITDLKTQLDKNRQELEAHASALTAQKEALAVAATPVPPPAPVAVAAPIAADRMELLKQVDGQVRETLLQSGVSVRMMPGELPQTVKDAMATVAPGVEITRCEQRQYKNQSYVRMRGRLDGQDLDYRITSDGGILEADLPLEVVPEVVKQAAAKAVPGWQLVDATQRLRDGAVIFDLGGRAEQKKYELRLSATGTVMDVEVHGGHNHGGRNQGGAPKTQKPPAPPPVPENF